MTISVFDLFKVGIGPSSSHTVGPMRAAYLFVTGLREDGLLSQVTGLRCELFGSRGDTGHGHGSVKAVVLGFAGEQPHLVDPFAAQPQVDQIRATGQLPVAGEHPVPFAMDDDIVLHRRKRLDFHTNGMLFSALGPDGEILRRREYYSVGGGFVLDEDEAGRPVLVEDGAPVQSPERARALKDAGGRVSPRLRDAPHPFTTGDQLLARTRETGLSISEIMMENELSWRTEDEIRSGLLHIWSVMQECVEQGIATPGVLPGGLKVRRRAGALHAQLTSGGTDHNHALRAMEWVTLYALAVNEQNAAGGRVVTAPTNGAAGIVPAVLHYYRDFLDFSEDGVVRYLLVAAAIGILFKENASISGAEVGCQGEVGSACAMAAGGLAELLGGTPDRVVSRRRERC